MELSKVLELVADNTWDDKKVDLEELITNLIDEADISVDLRSIKPIEEALDEAYNEGKEDAENE